MSLRRSPKPGALTAATLTVPRMLLTTNVDNASPSTSSAIINNGLLDLATVSKVVNNSRMLEIFLSAKRIKGFSNSAVPLSLLVMKYGDR